MGTVYRAFNRLSGQEVALKRVLLPPDLTLDETERELLTLAHEFRTLAGLRHLHIIVARLTMFSANCAHSATASAKLPRSL
jgi:hypothetical protein